MSLFFKRELNFLDANQLLNQRTAARSRSGFTQISTDKALRHSAVWACRRLRADLISTMPIDVFRRVNGTQIEVTKPAVFITPGGDNVDWCEWVYSSQGDLDTSGNAVGVITQTDAAGLPARIELASFDDVVVHAKGSTITSYRINGEKYDPKNIWHERQHTVAGLPVGLSPIAHAAISLGGYLSAQEFALDWFSGGGIPAARMKNTSRTLDAKQAQDIKDRFNATMRNGDLLVHGSDWEYDTIAAKASESAFIDQMQYGVTDICRFMGVPADMIDAQTSTGSITYANVTQRNLQLLIMNINPGLVRRETTFSRKLLPMPRYVKFNRGALLEMDLKTRYEANQIAINSRTLAPSEARALEDRPPFTPEQLAEFDQLFGSRAPAPVAFKSLEANPPRSRESLTVNTPEVRCDPTINIHMPQAGDINLPEQRAEITFVNDPAPVPVVTVNVEPTPITVDAPVTVNVEPTPVTITTPEVRVDVQPSELIVLEKDPKTRRIERDANGEIVAVVEES